MTFTTLRSSDHPVVLYGRVSQARDSRDNRATSVDDQLTELRRWARREGWPIVGEYRDDGISASKYAHGQRRSGWQQAMTVVESGQVRALLVWDLSRATRDRAVSVALETACADRGVKIGYGGMLRDPRTSDGSFYIGLDGLMAAKLSADISEKVQRNVEETRAPQGRPHGALPYGYKRQINPITGRTDGWEHDPERAPVVREVVRRLLAHESSHAIARDLNSRGVLTASGKPWRSGNLSKMALRPAYAGLRVHHGAVLHDVTATWPPIISTDDHYRLRALFGSLDRDKFRCSTATKYLGSGLYRCGRDGCDGRVRVVAERSQPRYACRDCHRVSRRQHKVDAYVEGVIVERLSRPDALDALTGPGDDQQRQQAVEEVTRLRAEEADMLDLLRDGRLHPRDLAVWRDGWTPRLDAAERAALPPALPGALTDMAGRPDAAELWRAAPITARRAVLDALMIVTILPIGRRSRPFDPATEIKIEWK